MARKPNKRHPVIQPRRTSYRYIALTRNQTAVVDVQNFESLSLWNWQAKWNPYTKSFYATRTYRKVCIYMHRQILKCKKGERCDHRNHDTLDNRKRNLRKATNAQNTWNSRRRENNSSGFIGVHWGEYMKKWRSRITVNGKRVSLGVFNNAEEAAKAYDAVAILHRGEFATLNFPEG